MKAARSFLCGARAPLALLPLLTLACLGEGAAKSEDPVVELPRYVVEDSRIRPVQEAWDYAQGPGFEVLSSLPRHRTTAFLKDFLVGRQVLSTIWPSVVKTPPGAPRLILVLTDRMGGFAEYLSPDRKQDEDSLNVIELSNASGGGAVVVDFNKATIKTSQLDTRDALTSGDSDSSSMADEARPGELASDPFRAAREGYIRTLVSRSGRAPAWFVEGMVRVLAAVDTSDAKVIEVGRVEGVNVDDFAAQLGTRKLLPMERLFGPKPKDLDEAYIWNAQSYAFVHMCLFGERQKLREPFVRFTASLSGEVPGEDHVRKYFGEGLDGLKERLRAYIWDGRHAYNRAEAKGKGATLYTAPEMPEVRDATAAEVGRLRGESLCLAGDVGRGRGFMLTSYQEGSRHPDLLAAFGLVEARGGNVAQAEKLLAAATKGGTQRQEAYVVQAKLLASQALAGKPQARLSRAQLDAILALLRSGASVQEPGPELVTVAATAWGKSTILPTREQFAEVLGWSAALQGRGSVCYSLAALAVSAGYLEEAAALIVQGEAVSQDARGRDLFTRLRAGRPELEAAIAAVRAKKST